MMEQSNSYAVATEVFMNEPGRFSKFLGIMDKSIFQDELEKTSHEDAIRRLCQEHPGQEEFIRKSYMELLEPLILEATIRTYLAIFVSRDVEAMISKQKH
jgi:hypothetical protein